MAPPQPEHAQTAIWLLLVIGLGSTVLGGFLVILLRSAAITFFERRGPMAGEWQDEIYADGGTSVDRRDKLVLRQRPKSDYVHGHIERSFPAKEKGRKWKFAGRYREGNLIVVFWSSDQTVLSFGCCYLEHVDDYQYAGYFLGPRGEDEEIPKVKIVLTKVR